MASSWEGLKDQLGDGFTIDHRPRGHQMRNLPSVLDIARRFFGTVMYIGAWSFGICMDLEVCFVCEVYDRDLELRGIFRAILT